mmetsp:Transcript_1720/g.2999  ORF Transcript_1720/g.2999 Transcript_1720/m.2999 type:complete len:80 (+) Transcript_1720:54-293(+)
MRSASDPDVVDLTGDGAVGGAGDGPAARLTDIDEELAAVESELEALLQRQAWLQEERRRALRYIEVEARAPRADWGGEF